MYRRRREREDSEKWIDKWSEVLAKINEIKGKPIDTTEIKDFDELSHLPNFKVISRQVVVRFRDGEICYVPLAILHKYIYRDAHGEYEKTVVVSEYNIEYALKEMRCFKE